MRALRSRARHRTPEDRGTTLVEMSVAMAITGVIALATAAVYAGVGKNVNAVRLAVDTTAEARIGLDSISRTLRVAVLPAATTPAMVTATATGMSFYASLDRSGTSAATTPNPSLVTYSWTGTCVKETRILGVGSSAPYTFPGTGAVTRCVLNTRTPPVFSYYATAVAGGAAITPLPITTTAGLGAIVAVQVSLTATRTVGGRATTVVDQVTLANVLLAGAS